MQNTQLALNVDETIETAQNAVKKVVTQTDSGGVQLVNTSVSKPAEKPKLKRTLAKTNSVTFAGIKKVVKNNGETNEKLLKVSGSEKPVKKSFEKEELSRRPSYKQILNTIENFNKNSRFIQKKI